MKGLILIPDISGFTSFVNTVDDNVGVSIISELLRDIIDNNILSLELSEIEGDALLYYNFGSPISSEELFQGCTKMYESFKTRYTRLKTKYNLKAELSLKFIVHYGEISVFALKGFRKLYGSTVIESHSLLKNGKGKSDYILITEDYFKAFQTWQPDNFDSQWKSNRLFLSQHVGLREIAYTFYDYDGHPNGIAACHVLYQ